MSTASSDAKNSSSTNPFDDESSAVDVSVRSGAESVAASTDSSAVESNNSDRKSLAFDMESVRQRGALIQGTVLGADRGSMSNGTSDLETGSEAPVSDYASHPPTSLWQPNLSPDDIRRQIPIQSDGRSSDLKQRKRTTLFLILGIISLVVVGAVGVVAYVVFGKDDKANSTRGAGNNTDPGDQKPVVLTNRQQILSDIMATVSSPHSFLYSGSPQNMARNWLLFDDSVWLNPEDGDSEDRVIQRYVLGVLFYSTGGPTNWGPNDWMEGGECDEDVWDGLDCNHKGEIKTIALDQWGLAGTVPEEVGHLSLLENLVLKNNKGLKGTIPGSLGKLSYLRQLGIYYCELGGSIPAELFQATSLTYLNLQDNKLTGTLSKDIGNLRELETLVLINNKLEGEVPYKSMAFSRLKFLGLGSNQFSGEILPAIGYYDALEFLYLERNNFEGQLSEFISTASKLKSINLDHNNITGTVPSTLGRLSDLEYFSIAQNDLQGELPDEIGEMTSCKTINLASNKLSGSLPDMTRMTNIQNLLLSRNELSGPIPDSIARLQSLEVLFLSTNQFTGSIPYFDRSGYELRGLYLSENDLTRGIPDSICGLKNLEALFLDNNELTGSIPSCINRLTNLQQLYVFDNELSGEIPSELGTMRQLTGIGLEHNDFSGSVPDEVCDRSEDDSAIDIWSDCGGEAPSLACPCCIVCCPSENCV